MKSSKNEGQKEGKQSLMIGNIEDRTKHTKPRTKTWLYRGPYKMDFKLNVQPQSCFPPCEVINVD